ncbi:MAG: glycosyltransferase family 4 protein [bacterium]
MNILIDANTLYQKDCGSKTYTYNLLKEFLILGQINKNNLNQSNYTINNINNNINIDINKNINIDICGISGNIFPLTSVEQLDDIAYKANYKNFLTKFKKYIPQDYFLYPYIKSFYRNIKKSINKINIYSANKKGKIYDIFFTPYQMEIDAGIAKHKFITIHDIYALTQPENYLTKSYAASFKKYLETYLPYFDAILTVSEFTKNEIAEYFNYPKEKIFVVHGGFDKKNYKKTADEEKVKKFKEKYGINKPYLLYVGIIEPRKNIPNLLKAYKELKWQAAANGSINTDAGGGVNMEDKTVNKPAFDFDLILVSGSSALACETFKLIEELKPDVKVFKGVNNEDLNLFYNAADLFVFPSLYEGFGIPPLEAFACETPVIASNATSIPEICKDGAYYFDPRDINDIKNAITTVLNSQSIKNELIQKGLKTAKLYSFRNSAQEILNVFLSFRQA